MVAPLADTAPLDHPPLTTAQKENTILITTSLVASVALEADTSHTVDTLTALLVLGDTIAHLVPPHTILAQPATTAQVEVVRTTHAQQESTILM